MIYIARHHLCVDIFITLLCGYSVDNYIQSITGTVQPRYFQCNCTWRAVILQHNVLILTLQLGKNNLLRPRCVSRSYVPLLGNCMHNASMDKCKKHLTPLQTHWSLSCTNPLP